MIEFIKTIAAGAILLFLGFAIVLLLLYNNWYEWVFPIVVALIVLWFVGLIARGIWASFIDYVRSRNYRNVKRNVFLRITMTNQPPISNVSTQADSKLTTATCVQNMQALKR